MKLLLDTCTFLWLASGADRISKLAREALVDGDNEKYLSAASAWEIAIKYAWGRMPLPESPEFYVARVRDKSGIETLSVDEESALYTPRLPKLHADPFDRLLVAQAIVHGMTILTPDKAIGQYAVRTLW